MSQTILRQLITLQKFIFHSNFLNLYFKQGKIVANKLPSEVTGISQIGCIFQKSFQSKEVARRKFPQRKKSFQNKKGKCSPERWKKRKELQWSFANCRR